MWESVDNLKTKIFEMVEELDKGERERKRGSENLASMWVAREENRRL